MSGLQPFSCHKRCLETTGIPKIFYLLVITFVCSPSGFLVEHYLRVTDISTKLEVFTGWYFYLSTWCQLMLRCWPCWCQNNKCLGGKYISCFNCELFVCNKTVNTCNTQWVSCNYLYQTLLKRIAIKTTKCIIIFIYKGLILISYYFLR